MSDFTRSLSKEIYAAYGDRPTTLTALLVDLLVLIRNINLANLPIGSRRQIEPATAEENGDIATEIAKKTFLTYRQSSLLQRSPHSDSGLFRNTLDAWYRSETGNELLDSISRCFQCCSEANTAFLNKDKESEIRSLGEAKYYLGITQQKAHAKHDALAAQHAQYISDAEDARKVLASSAALAAQTEKASRAKKYAIKLKKRLAAQAENAKLAAESTQQLEIALAEKTKEAEQTNHQISSQQVPISNHSKKGGDELHADNHLVYDECERLLREHFQSHDLKQKDVALDAIAHRLLDYLDLCRKNNKKVSFKRVADNHSACATLVSTMGKKFTLRRQKHFFSDVRHGIPPTH